MWKSFRAPLVLMLALACQPLLAQELGLENIGRIQAVSSAGDSVTIDGQTLRISNETVITADQRTDVPATMSLQWVGRKVAYEWYDSLTSGKVLTGIYFFGNEEPK